MAENEEQILRSIGLSKAAAQCYLLLAANPRQWMRAALIAESLPIKHATLYRALKQLEMKGFIKARRIVVATSYQAEALSYALDNYALYQRQQALPIIKKQNKKAGEGLA